MKRTLQFSLPLTCLVLALSACGGSSSNSEPVVKVPDPVLVPPVKMSDAFTKFVMNFLLSAPDDQEAVAVNDVALTTPEDVEPEALK